MFDFYFYIFICILFLRGFDFIWTTRWIGENPESSDLLHLVMVGLAEESASIGFERAEAEREGKGTSTISVRRIGALKSVAETWLRRKEQLVDREILRVGHPFKVNYSRALEGTPERIAQYFI